MTSIKPNVPNLMIAPDRKPSVLAAAISMPFKPTTSDIKARLEGTSAKTAMEGHRRAQRDMAICL